MSTRPYPWLAAAALFALTALPALAAPKIAIFNDGDFPYWGAPSGLTGPDMQTWFARLGLSADLLDDDALGDPQRFNAEKYAAYIHLYGNTFPESAGENLRRFHEHGGSLISAGVPFCHPCRRTGAFGWSWVGWGPDQDEIAQEAAHSGALGIRISKRLDAWTGIQQTEKLPAKAGETFTVGGWVKTTDASAGRKPDELLLRYWDKGGRFLGQTGPQLPASNKDWQFISQSVTTPPDTAQVDVVLALWKPSATICVDDLVLVRGEIPADPTTAAKANLLPDPGFERGGGEWKDLGHVEWFGHDKLGTGGFYTSTGARGELLYQASADPLSLAVLDWPSWQRRYLTGTWPTQALNPTTLPAEDKIAPIVAFKDAAGTWPLVALIKHNCAQFRGTIDAWAGTSLFYSDGNGGSLPQREAFGRAALYVLQERGLLTGKADLLRRADAAYRAALPPANLKPVAAQRNYDGVFPKCNPPARKLIVADVSGLALDEKLAFTSLEGIINGRQPRLYLVTDQYGTEGGKLTVDERWLEWLKTRGDIEGSERPTDPWSLLTKWPGEVKGAVITDPDLPATINIATMICGLEGAVMLSPRLAKEHKLPVVADLRGRWKTNVAAYQWAITNLWPRLNHNLLGLMWPDWTRPRDYLIAQKAFCFWITGPKDAKPGVASPLEETALIAKFLGQIPTNIGTLGAPWAGDGVGIQEGPGVTLLSEYGKFLAWSAETGNLSVHSGTKPPVFKRPMAPAPTLDRSKVYLTFMVSDGDAPINWYGFFLIRYWDDPVRGQIPLVWSLGPTSYDLMPNLLDYYYRKSGTNDSFVCACSGVGYCYPNIYGSRYAQPERLFQGYVDLTRQYMGRFDERGLWTHTADPERLRQFAAGVPAMQYFLPDYSRQPDTTATNATGTISGIPSFRAVVSFDPKGGPEQALKLIVDDIRKYTPPQRPAFLNAFVQCYPCSPTLLKQVLDQLGPEYVPVLPEHLAELYKAAGK